MPNVWPSPGSTYCAAHSRARRAHQKRHHKRVERARRDGKPLPIREPYEPRPVIDIPGAHFTPAQVSAYKEALSQALIAEDRLRRALDGTDPREVGRTAQNLLDAGVELRGALQPLRSSPVEWCSGGSFV